MLCACACVCVCVCACVCQVRQLTDSEEYTGEGIMVCFVSRQMHHAGLKFQQYSHTIECAREAGTYMELGRFEFKDFHKCVRSAHVNAQ